VGCLSIRRPQLQRQRLSCFIVHTATTDRGDLHYRTTCKCQYCDNVWISGHSMAHFVAGRAPSPVPSRLSSQIIERASNSYPRRAPALPFVTPRRGRFYIVSIPRHRGASHSSPRTGDLLFIKLKIAWCPASLSPFAEVNRCPSTHDLTSLDAPYLLYHTSSFLICRSLSAAPK